MALCFLGLGITSLYAFTHYGTRFYVTLVNMALGFVILGIVALGIMSQWSIWHWVICHNNYIVILVLMALVIMSLVIMALGFVALCILALGFCYNVYFGIECDVTLGFMSHRVLWQGFFGVGFYCLVYNITLNSMALAPMSYWVSWLGVLCHIGQFSHGNYNTLASMALGIVILCIVALVLCHNGCFGIGYLVRLVILSYWVVYFSLSHCVGFCGIEYFDIGYDVTLGNMALGIMVLGMLAMGLMSYWVLWHIRFSVALSIM